MTSSDTATGRWSPGSGAADRVLLQVRGVDAWTAYRRERAQFLRRAGLDRAERIEAARQSEALGRTHATVVDRCARSLDAALVPRPPAGRTAVVAHRHAWLVQKLVLLLEDRGLTVLAQTDDGAEALGVVIAEQPDVLLAGERLALLPARALLQQTRRFSPATARALHGSDEARAQALRDQAEAVFSPRRTLDAVADVLSGLHPDRA